MSCGWAHAAIERLRFLGLSEARGLTWPKGMDRQLPEVPSPSHVREPGRAPPRHAHGDLTSLAPHERLPEILTSTRAAQWATLWFRFGENLSQLHQCPKDKAQNLP